jgi:hypothetical protein
MSTILEYTVSRTSLNTVDGEVQLQSPIIFRQGRVRNLRVISASISSKIPNVFSTNTFTNAVVAVSQDGGATYTNVVLPNGVFSINFICEAINSATAAWWTDPSDPGFELGTNLATDFVYLRLDSTKHKTVGAQIAINFGVSRISELLGFVTMKLFAADGLYSASNEAQMDWFGNRVLIELFGFGPMSVVGGAQSQKIAAILLSGAVINEYSYPSPGGISPFVPVNVSGNINSFSVRVTGSRLNTDGSQRALYITEGQFSILLEIA